MFKTRHRWIGRFTDTMSGFGLEADADHIVELAEVAYELHNKLDPAAVARAELDKWPHSEPPQFCSHNEAQTA